jgi:hypothetical protein
MIPHQKPYSIRTSTIKTIKASYGTVILRMAQLRASSLQWLRISTSFQQQNVSHHPVRAGHNFELLLRPRPVLQATACGATHATRSLAREALWMSAHSEDCCSIHETLHYWPASKLTPHDGANNQPSRDQLKYSLPRWINDAGKRSMRLQHTETNDGNSYAR